MTDDTPEGAVPIEDDEVDEPPTVDEVLEEQRRRDDLPDPSDDPDHQQVAEPRDDDDGADADLQQLLIDEAVEEGEVPEGSVRRPGPVVT